MSKDGAAPPPAGPSERPARGPAADRPDGLSQSATGVDAGTAAGDVDKPFAQLLAGELHTRMAVLAPSGPPRGGLDAVRRRAGARRRRRAATAAAAGTLAAAVVVTLASGNRFGLMPSLTGAVGSGLGAVPTPANGHDPTRQPTGAGDGHRTVRPGGAGRTGPAIGPGTPISTPPSSDAAMVPLCTAASVSTTTTVGPAQGGIVYGHVDSVALAACVAVGPPVLTVTNQNGDAAASVRILPQDAASAGLLPLVPTWGTMLVLSPGQAYQLQFAWAPEPCAGPSAGALPSASASPTPVAYSLGYAVAGTTPAGLVSLDAACGARVFVTDIYRAGSYPLARTTSSPSAGPGAGSPTGGSSSPTASTQPSTSPGASPAGGPTLSASATPS